MAAPFQSHGFQTSVDQARQQTYAVQTSVRTSAVSNGAKRPRQDSDPSTAAKSKHNGRFGNRVDFVRASTASSQGQRLVASEIRLASGAAEADASVNRWGSQPSAPSATQNSLLSLQHPRYGLPPALVANFAAIGIDRIYPWQASCLLGRGHLSGEKNLLYTAPTGGGKSLVADVLMLKRVIENPHSKAILVLPYVALVQEKLKALRRLVQDVEKNVPEPGDDVRPRKQLNKSVRVTGFFGGSKSRSTWADTDIAVCTIEKANSLINTAIEECTINDLGIVVLDEIHMLDDQGRGYILELIVSKLLCLLPNAVQIVGMSATLSNTELLAQWLGAILHVSNHRPVPIEEYLVYDNAIYPAVNSKAFFETASKLSSSELHSAVSPHRLIASSSFRELSNPANNALVSLAVETATAGYGALVFCSSRQACQSNAMLISAAMPDPSQVEPDILEKRLDVLAELESLPCGLDPVLQKTIVKGVAFHHAGLTTEERDIVANAYDQGIVKVIVATCSLAAGVNLPARRVIIQGARMGRDLVGPALLRQMRGRAGRKGKDVLGETYLICQKTDLEAISGIWEAETPAIESCLGQDGKAVQRALLEAIATKMASGREAILDYMKCTLLYRTHPEEEIMKLIDAALQELTETELVVERVDGGYEPTKLGSAIVASSFAPEDGIFVYHELKRALQAFVMDGEMHVFYMFTPIQVAMNTTIDWPTFRDQLDSLDESGLRALQFVGVQPGFVNNMVQSGRTLSENNPAHAELIRIYRRAYAAFQLRDLSNEVPLTTIAQRYHTPRGVVQTLAQTCHGFAAGMVKFCQRMGWGMLAVVLDHMRDRLQAGARDDLLEMAQVAYVKSWTARLLWENGFRSVRALAQADPKELVPVLMMARPRRDQKMQNPEDAKRYVAKINSKAEAIVASAAKIYERQVQVEMDEMEE